MNKLERVRAVLAGKEADRVPASFWFHFRPDKMHGQAAIQAHLDFYRQSNVDFLKVMNEHPYQTNVEIKSPSRLGQSPSGSLSVPIFIKNNWMS